MLRHRPALRTQIHPSPRTCRPFACERPPVPCWSSQFQIFHPNDLGKLPGRCTHILAESPFQRAEAHPRPLRQLFHAHRLFKIYEATISATGSGVSDRNSRSRNRSRISTRPACSFASLICSCISLQRERCIRHSNGVVRPKRLYRGSGKKAAAPASVKTVSKTWLPALCVTLLASGCNPDRIATGKAEASPILATPSSRKQATRDVSGRSVCIRSTRE